MDEFYNTKIGELETEIQRLKADINLISREYDKLSLSITTVHQNLEVWRDREQTIRENYDKMEQKLTSMTNLKKKTKDIEKQQLILLTEEIASLKAENKKLESLCKLISKNKGL